MTSTGRAAKESPIAGTATKTPAKSTGLDRSYETHLRKLPQARQQRDLKPLEAGKTLGLSLPLSLQLSTQTEGKKEKAKEENSFLFSDKEKAEYGHSIGSLGFAFKTPARETPAFKKFRDVSD